MDKQFPEEMLKTIKAAQVTGKVKLILFSDPDTPNLTRDCHNCCGLGFFHVFIASEGPYQLPAAPYSGLVSHWHDRKWWVGQSYSFKCPKCEGLGYIRENVKSVPVQQFTVPEWKF